MAITGRTGADAIFKSIKHVCSVIKKYSGKFNALITLAEASSVITPTESAVVTAFLAGLTPLCDILEKLAGFSGF